MKLFLKINKDVEVWSDQHCFIVKRKKENGNWKDYWYLPTLEMALAEVFDYLIKEKGAFKLREDLDKLIRTLKSIKREIMDSKPASKISSKRV
ncbi:unnamed protein product [marine sediment metagenome]|uniref:Uncharacterized protein n=1 Tax=marine sediment metagenome TaxID=412755 RepID=X1GKA1_9ZZZZ